MAAKHECSICVDIYTNPKLLPCSHTFCFKCLEDYVKVNLRNGEFKCPLCRETIRLPVGGVSAFKANFYISSKPSENRCNQHLDQEIRLYCRDCKVLICTTCIDSHQRHYVQNLSKAAAEVKKSLKLKMKSCAGKVKHLTESEREIEELNKKISDAEENEIQALENQHLQLVDLIDKEVGNMKYKIHNVYEDLRKQNAGLIKDVKEKLKTFSTALDNARQIFDHGTDIDIIKKGSDLGQLLSTSKAEAVSKTMTSIEKDYFSPAKINIKELISLIGMIRDSTNIEKEYSSMRMALKEKNYLIVAAIDIGTDYSGYAFQFKHELEKDPTRILFPSLSYGGKMGELMSYKTPTSLLLDKSQKVHSYGFEAEYKYEELCMDGGNTTWYYFRRFMMKLHEGEGPKKDSKLQDETGKIMSALQVFSLYIQCLTNHLMKLLDKQGTPLKMEEIHWVLTVPAIWNDSAKLFMRTAAEQAGILSNDIDIASESEAASLYYQYLSVDTCCTQKGQVHFGAAPPGTIFMVLVLGGDNAVIAIHEKLIDCNLKEIAKASGGPWGSKSVDNAFIRLLKDIVGDTVMAAFQKDEMDDYLGLLRGFEHIKRNLTASSNNKLNILLPSSLLHIVKDKIKCTMKDCVEKSAYKNEIQLSSDKMRVDPELVRDLFREVTDKIVSHVESSLKTNPGVSMILMVGGFSESGFVQDVIRSKFQDKMVIVPREADLSNLKGAVIFGLKREIIEPTISF